MSKIQRIIFVILSLSLWLTKINAQSIVFETSPTNFTKAEIEKELDKYPNELLSKYLKQVVVVKTDKYCGLSYGISNTPRIEINDDSRCNVSVTIHHELSSIFLLQYDKQISVVDDLQQAFIDLNGDFSYTYQVDFGKVDSGTEIANHFYSLKYSMNSFENDFNVIAECLFSNGKEVINFMNENSDLPVSKKIRLVLEFYQKLSPVFTFSYFERQKI